MNGLMEGVILEMTDKLTKLWEMQRSYNTAIRILEETHSADKTFWSEKYLLGLTSEIDEVLREMNWKIHRQNIVPNQRNLAFELADLTKYVLSLWQIWGYTLDEVLDVTLEKSEVVELRTEMELAADPEGENVLITDLDGTLADWRSSFLKWVHDNYGVKLDVDPQSSLLLDADMLFEYPEYNRWKDEFEAVGEYRHLIPFQDGIDTVRKLRAYGAYVIAYTARPAGAHKQIWWDTYQWMKEQKIAPDKLFIGAEARILAANSLRQGNNVILFEDDPGILLRAAIAGIRSFGRAHPYNSSITHDNITWVKKFTDLTPDEYWGKELKNV